MADITKCSGEGCLLRSTCYRFTAPGDGRGQSWFPSPPLCNDGCAYYLQIAGKETSHD
jgi:hypothetical protein